MTRNTGIETAIGGKEMISGKSLTGIGCISAMAGVLVGLPGCTSSNSSLDFRRDVRNTDALQQIRALNVGDRDWLSFYNTAETDLLLQMIDNSEAVRSVNIELADASTIGFNVISQMNSLQSLRIVGSVGDADLTVLATLPSLIRLELVNTGISARSLRQLIAELPLKHLVFIDEDGSSSSIGCSFFATETELSIVRVYADWLDSDCKRLLAEYGVQVVAQN